MKMKAAVLNETNTPFSIETVDLAAAPDRRSAGQDGG